MTARRPPGRHARPRQLWPLLTGAAAAGTAGILIPVTLLGGSGITANLLLPADGPLGTALASLPDVPAPSDTTGPAPAGTPTDAPPSGMLATPPSLLPSPTDSTVTDPGTVTAVPVATTALPTDIATPTDLVTVTPTPSPGPVTDTPTPVTATSPAVTPTDTQPAATYPAGCPAPS